MKVLIYAHAFAPSVGGAETYIMNLAQGLARRAPGELTSVQLITETPAGNFDDRSVPFPVLRQPSIRQLFESIRKVDIVHIAGPVMKVMLVAAISNRAFVVEHHGYQVSCPNGLLMYGPNDEICPDRFMRKQYGYCLKCNAFGRKWSQSFVKVLAMWPRRLLCRIARKNVCVSEHVKRRVRLPRSVVIYHGVKEYSDRPGNRNERQHESTLTVAYVGRLVGEKGVPVLVEAVRLIQSLGREMRLKIIGDGPERERVQVAAAALTNPTAEFTGLLTGAALENAQGDVDVTVIPTRMEETAGLAVMEQMMRGHAVVVSDVGALPETAGEGGLTFRAGDPASLARRLEQFDNDRSLLQQVGLRGQNRAKAVFGVERMVSDHLRLFREALNSPMPVPERLND